MPDTPLHPAFKEPAREAQSVFRLVANALGRPGKIFDFTATFVSPAPLLPSAAAILLTLADFETTIWLDATLSEHKPVADFLRFHTGGAIIDKPENASFALIADPMNAPSLSAFAQGEVRYPDRSTTIIMQIEELHPSGWRLAGPGIHGETGFRPDPVPDDFIQQIAVNGGQFPLGVDLIFTSSNHLAAMPRSTKIVGAA